jgi:hypothetical protein
LTLQIIEKKGPEIGQFQLFKTAKKPSVYGQEIGRKNEFRRSEDQLKSGPQYVNLDISNKSFFRPAVRDLVRKKII